jgi:ubiquinone/menaquinone biosynthesis C-methylase UbiE
MEKNPSGYPIERRVGEIERLRIQGEAMAADAAIMLDRIGVEGGWRCADIGCGPCGITNLLSNRVGAAGHVVGLDADAVFLNHARQWARARGLDNVQYVVGDAFNTGLPDGSFDLVHMRFVASTVGQPVKLLKEAMRVARPGGIVALQEPDISTLNCYPPHPAWQRLREVLEKVFDSVGGDVRLAQRLYQLARQAGMEDVQYRPFLVGVRSCDPMVDYLPATIESLRGTLVNQRLIASDELEEALGACRVHLANPDTVFTTYTVAQVWGHTVAGFGNWMADKIGRAGLPDECVTPRYTQGSGKGAR